MWVNSVIPIKESFKVDNVTDVKSFYSLINFGFGTAEVRFNGKGVSSVVNGNVEIKVVAFGTGTVDITGTLSTVLVSVDMLSSDRSKFGLLLASSGKNSDTGLLTFKEPEVEVVIDPYEEMMNKLRKSEEIKKKTAVNVHLLIHATPIAEAMLEIDKDTGSAINVDADLWRLSSNISMGFHAGIGGAETSLVSIFPLPIGFHYGINLHYHVLPQLGDLPGHWDIVLNSEVGSYTCPHLSPQLEYGFGATFTYYPFTHWGIFVEGTWGRFCYNQLYNAKVETGRSLLEAGLSLRF